MKNILILILFIGVSIFCYSQTEMYPLVIGTFGGSSELSNDYDISYTSGETFYHSYETENFSILEGFNQIVYTTTDISENQYTYFDISVYPNPSNGLINLQLNTINFDNFKFTIYDLSGKIIDSSEITEKNTQIDLTSLANSVFLVNVTENQKVIKTFRIIKNQ